MSAYYSQACAARSGHWAGIQSLPRRSPPTVRPSIHLGRPHGAGILQISSPKSSHPPAGAQGAGRIHQDQASRKTCPEHQPAGGQCCSQSTGPCGGGRLGQGRLAGGLGPRAPAFCGPRCRGPLPLWALLVSMMTTVADVLGTEGARLCVAGRPASWPRYWWEDWAPPDHMAREVWKESTRDWAHPWEPGTQQVSNTR